jgi:hypothetical protein
MLNAFINELNIMKKIISYVMAIIAFSALTACGSGSNDSTANQGPQGLWIGTTNTGYDLATIVLENGDYYSLYSQDEIIIGANYGNIITTDNAFIGTLKDIYVPNNKTNSGSLAGSFVPKATLQGITSYDDNKVGAFTTTYRDSYDTPATLEAIAGQYSGPIFRSSLIATLDIDNDGTVNGYTQRTTTTLPSCMISGNVVPRASGKNVYDLKLVWKNNPDPNAPICCNPGSSTCATGTPTTGIAVVDGTYLYTAWINVANTGGFLWRGSKQ